MKAIVAVAVVSIAISFSCFAAEKTNQLGTENSPAIKAFNDVSILAKRWKAEDKAWYVKEPFLIQMAGIVQKTYSPDKWAEKMTKAYNKIDKVLDDMATSYAYEAVMESKEAPIYDWMREKLKERGLDKETFEKNLAASSNADNFFGTVRAMSSFFAETGGDPNKSEEALIKACNAAIDLIRYPAYWQCRRQIVATLFPDNSSISQQFLIDAEMIAYREERGEITRDEARALIDRLSLAAQERQKAARNADADRQMTLMQIMASQPRRPGMGEVFFESLSRSLNRRTQSQPTTCESYVVMGQLRTTCR